MSMTYDANAPAIEPRPNPPLSDSIMEMFSLKGRVAVVCGSASGIGLAACEAFAEAGADVAMWYNSNDAAIARAAELAKRYGVRAKAYKVGVTAYEPVHKAVADVVADFGKLDIFVANAGAGMPGGILEQSVDDWHKIVNINYHGVFYCAKAAGEVFKKQGKGNLIITSSMSAHIVNVPVDQPCYNSTKAAVTHLGKSLAREWREFARVNIVSPGFVKTDMGAAPQVLSEAYRMSVMGRQADPRELKGAYLYLASDASTYATGTDLIIDGGYSLP